MAQITPEEAKPKRPMWRSIFHDTENDRMYVWYTDGTMDAVPSVHEFYTDKQGEYGAKPCGMKDIWDRDVYKVEVPPANGVSAFEVEKAIKQNHAGPTNHLAEIDIDPRGRFLQKHYADTGVIHPDMKDINLGFLDIENATTGRFSLPTEAKYPINVVTFYVSKEDKYYTYGVAKDISEKGKQFLKENNGEYILCTDEADLLTKLLFQIGASDLDILSGWNFGFDTVYICNRLKQVNEKLPPKDRISLDLLSRMRGKNKRAYLNAKNELVINGTEVIDFLELYKKYTFSEEASYKLDYIGKKIVGESKAPLPDGYLSWQKYWEDYVLYNFQDVKLLVKIEIKAQMFRLAVTSAAAARVPFSSVFSSKKMLTGFMLDHLHHTNRTFPPYRQQHKEVFPGAFVYSVPGYKEYLVSYDYRSLYPSIMMTFNTSPEMKVTFPIDYVLTEEEKKNLIKSPWDHNGRYQVYFRKDKVGVVPEVTRLLFDGRSNLKKQMKKAKKNGDKEMAGVYDMMQKVYKVLGNSLYGLMGSELFALYDVDNAASITAYGQRLIKYTIARLSEYINNDIHSDPVFKKVFGYEPDIDPELVGTFTDAEGEVNYKRMSHGDTDSFFVKFGDIYEQFRLKQGTGTEVIVFDKHEIVERYSFDNDHELDSKKAFNRLCTKYGKENWTGAEMRTPDEKTGWTKAQITFADGIFMTGDYRIIYNRYRLTDFCRILDACILEEKLDEYMLSYANQWGYLTNELFLKREKCIHKAIVTAKKKYICLVESMEDIVYLDLGHKDDNKQWVKGTLAVKPEYAITGLELVRSSTALFGKDRMMDMVDLMMDTMDKATVRNRLLEIKKEFFDSVQKENFSYIACPCGVKNDPPPLEVLDSMPAEEKKKIDWRVKAGAVWNYLIQNDPELSKFPYEPVYAGSKIRFIKKADRLFGVSIICYTGDKCPPRLLEIFHPDWEEHWKVCVAQVLGRLFKAVGWDERLEYDESDFMLSMF
jgi:DNA polymerase elongation subunit (family B)